MYSIPALLVILNTALQTVSAVALAPEDHSHPSAVVESVQASETDKHVAARAMQSVTVHKSGNPDRLSACELCKLTIEDCNKGGSLEHCQKQKCGLQKCKGCSDCAGVDEYRRREVEDQEEPEVETVHAPETAPMPRSVKVAARGRCHNDCYENINLCPNQPDIKPCWEEICGKGSCGGCEFCAWTEKREVERRAPTEFRTVQASETVAVPRSVERRGYDYSNDPCYGICNSEYNTNCKTSAMGTADNSKPNCLKILCTKDRPECRDCPSCKKFQRREIESQPPTEVKTEQASRTHKLASARGMETVTVPRSEERRKNVPKEDPCIKCEQKRALSARTLPTDLTVRLNATYSVPIMRMNALTAMFAYQSRDSKPAGESKCKDEESCPGSDCAFRGIC